MKPRKDPKKVNAGRLGGIATVKNHGERDERGKNKHMQTIGKRGAETTWNRYALYPAGTRGFVMWNKETGAIKTYIDYIPESK